MSSTDPLEATFGLFFGLFGFIYIIALVFIVVLTIVFMFKGMSYMKKKTQNDERLILAIQQLELNQNLQQSQEKEPKPNDLF
ncbi:hypothetical protein H1Z61_07060 [Bacillus aquiflavi]|uniref:DUF4083 domain-containing protein n=1 Tax=Bacillus aquiflavi TaxID=2672567 RepID=A0A6B3VZW2_9BACI|nr:hypothetical protein [Bacillus aquiflavi]MBA4536906.1 hypothetical protein [Bacillus aquiflavi]NEY81273.1 hypothetical protein [Bacillus aquiflavi]UAC47616.1 hypothetical protein K6959_13230 [Bacillus aquiflavi]